MRQSHYPVSPSDGLTPSTGAGRTEAESRLRLRANPIRLLFSASPWLAAGYLLTYLIVSGVLFSAAVAASTVTAGLAVTVALIPLLIGAAAVVRGCAEVARTILRQVTRPPDTCRGYPAPGAVGLWRRARTAWTSGATWRDMAYLVGLWVPLYALAAAVFAVWGFLLAGITIPLWYRYVANVCYGVCGNGRVPGVMFGYFPNGPHGARASGLWIYPSIGPALLVAAGCLVAFVLFNYVIVATAQLHARIGWALLRGPSDPLEPAKAVLAEPGPLGSLLDPPGS